MDLVLLFHLNLYINFMQHRFFCLFIFVLATAFGMLCVPSFAADVPLDSVKHLFVQNPSSANSHTPNSNDSLKKANAKITSVETSPNIEVPQSYAEIVKKEREEALLYRLAMVKALDEDRFDDLEQIVKDAEAYERTAKMYPVFFANDRFLIKYFLKNFEYLSNVDSVSKLLISNESYDELQGTLYRKLRREIESGKLEESVKNIENKSDRVFVYIILNSFFEKKEEVSSLIEKYKYQLTNDKQLAFLIKRFWKKEKLDESNYVAFSWGAAIVKSLGSLSDKIGLSPGMYLGIDFIRSDFLYEWGMDINGVQNKDPDSLQFYDMRWDFNFGYTFVKSKHVLLYGYGTVGFGMNAFNVRGKESKDKASDDLPYQFYPTFGAGAIVDLFFTDKGCFHNGLRFRTGFRSLFSGDVLKTSGIRLYASIEWTLHEYKKEPVEFDYSFRESGVK